MHLIRQVLLYIGLALISFTIAASSTPCNNSPSLCDRAYNNVTHLGAHDSPFLRPSLFGDQYYNSTTQLSAGVRLLTGQIYTTNATAGLHLCHTSCDYLDAGRLSTWLSSIKLWLDANPTDVVTILLVNGNGASTASIAAEYAAADIASYTYSPSTTSNSGTWPTLQTLISSNTRLVTFVASLVDSDTSAPYLIDEFDYIFENPYNVTSLSSFSCQPERPSSVLNNYPAAESASLMPLMNHFAYTSLLPSVQIPDEDDIYQTNAPTGSSNCTTGCLGTTAQQCAGVYGRAPSFVLVDFFNVGPSIDTVDTLNGVSDAVGRLSLSTVAAVPGGARTSSAGSATASATTSGASSATSAGTGASASTTRTSGAVAPHIQWVGVVLGVFGVSLALLP